jgi:hypothetical protein
MLHAIHGMFPPPEVTGHDGGKDSVSVKKLKRLEGVWHWIKEVLGFEFNGESRTVGLPADKAADYLKFLDEILAKTQIPFKRFRKLHGKLQHVCQVLPEARGFMTPLNHVLGDEPSTVGLGRQSVLREILAHMRTLIANFQQRPSHINELVPPDLPHSYGFHDSCSRGAGGVILPCTDWFPPTVWRVAYPEDIVRKLQDDANRHGLTNSDGEMAGSLLQKMLRASMRPMKHVSACDFADNTPTVSWNEKMATKSRSPIPARFIQASATMAHALEAAPGNTAYWKGKELFLADIPSRTVEMSNDEFLTYFNEQFRLPPQLGFWQLACLPEETVSAVFSLMRNEPLDIQQWTAPTGLLGPPLLLSVDPTAPSCAPCHEQPKGNVATCSWPLLNPSGKVDRAMANKLRARQSRRRFAHVPKSSSKKDITIPVAL